MNTTFPKKIDSKLEQALQQNNQSHLLQFVHELSSDQLEQFSRQLHEIDWHQLSRLVNGSDEAVDWRLLARKAEPPPAFALSDTNSSISRKAALEAGKQALREGRVGVILVAGGQGTRLGFQPPKGLFPIGPISNRTLFQVHCDRLLGLSRRYGVAVPMFVMTSPATDQETRDYFASNQSCGLNNNQLHIFCQGSMPAVDAKTGNVLLASKDSLALSPDGHGGLVQALKRSGCLEEAARRGIDYFYYAQVDNPLANLGDPELIGYHLLTQSQMTTHVVKKRFAKEKVGNVVAIDGKVQIIEYSDLPDEVAEQTLPDGSLKLWAGNIAVHVFDRSFLQSIVEDSVGLPFHRAIKKVPHLDSRGQMISPDEPNAIKFERFVFDLLPMADRAIVVEGDAADIFAPVKNADGAAVDTPEHSKQAMLAQHRRWIEAAGGSIADGVCVEINPRWALDAEEVAEKLRQRPMRFTQDTYLQ